MLLRVKIAVQLVDKTKQTRHTVTKMTFELMLITMARMTCTVI